MIHPSSWRCKISHLREKILQEMISTILSSPVPPSSRSREPLVRASSNRSATVAFLWRCQSSLTKDHDASTELDGVDEVPVGIEDDLLFALSGHPVHLELPLVL